jgi:hypothetical protein
LNEATFSVFRIQVSGKARFSVFSVQFSGKTYFDEGSASGFKHDVAIEEPRSPVGSADGAASYRKPTIARCWRALCGPTEQSRRQRSGIDALFEIAEPRSRTQTKAGFDSGATDT